MGNLRYGCTGMKTLAFLVLSSSVLSDAVATSPMGPLSTCN